MLGFLPFILFALPAGVWVDRLRRRPILIVGDASRAVLLALIPILWLAGVLQIWHLLVLQFVIGIFTVFFDVAYQSYLPALIEREHLVDGNSKLQLTVSVAQVAGPSMSAASSPPSPRRTRSSPTPRASSSRPSSCSGWAIARCCRERARASPKPKMWPQVKEGLQWVVGNRHLRAIAACTGSSNFFG